MSASLTARGSAQTDQRFSESLSSGQSLSPSALDGDSRPLVSIVLPAYNEAAVLDHSLTRVCQHMSGLEKDYRWEVVVINDGSTDETGGIAESFARKHTNVRVYHHFTNFGLGQALRFAASHCRGDYVLILDVDLTYSESHIDDLLTHIRATRAKIVLTSPYMKGGRVTNVPWLRKTLSIWGNRFLAASANANFSTLTSMVRVYDGRFLRSLNLRAMGMNVMPEILYKAKLLGARIEEIPAHLDWTNVQSAGGRRRSTVRLIRHTAATILSGFLFRPVMYFVAPGLLMLLFSVYVNSWMVAHFAEKYVALSQYNGFFERASAAVSAAYAQSPHTFLIGILSLMLAIQLISLGIISLQSKNYFEEIFHLASAIYRTSRERMQAHSNDQAKR